MDYNDIEESQYILLYMNPNILASIIPQLIINQHRYLLRHCSGEHKGTHRWVVLHWTKDQAI